MRMVDRYNTRKPVIGNLYVTTTHLIFADQESNKETWVRLPCANANIRNINQNPILHYYQMLLTHIDNVEKLALTTTGSPLLIRCKTFLSVTFVIAKERECHDIYQTLLKLSQPGNECYSLKRYHGPF